MNELHFAYRVRQHLNRGLQELTPDTTDRLAAAREAALAHQKQTVSLSALAMSGGLSHMHFDKWHIKQLLIAITLLLGVALSTLWIADQRVSELGDIDSALLADELPIGAFTDKGFDAWLRNSSSE